MKPILPIVFVLGWLVSVGGAYWLGKGQGRKAGRDEATIIAGTAAENSAPSKPRPATFKSGGNATGAGAAEASGPSVKQILAQVKTLIRTGGMNNPATAIKALTLLGQIREEDLPIALKEAEDTTDPQQKMMLYMVLLGKWAEKDGPAAMKYADEKLANAGAIVQMAKMGIVSSWAQNDPEAVWQWYRKQAETDTGGGPMGGRSMSLMSLFNSMASKDLEGALKRKGELESPEERRMALVGIFQSSYDDESRGRLFKEIDGMTDADERKQSRQMLLGQWAMLDPDKAISYVDSLPASERKEAAEGAGATLMMSDPKRAAEIMLKNADPDKPGPTYERIVSQWANQDVNAAGTWLSQQSQGPELDAARASFARAAASRDPESAMEWAKTVTVDDKRASAVESVYKNWQKKDAAAAGQALQNSGLPPEKIEEIIKKVQPKEKTAAGSPAPPPAN